MVHKERLLRVIPALILSCSFLATFAFAGRNEVLGEIKFKGITKIEKTSGVWVDGQYVGYVKELQGSKKVLLLPGKHQVVVRQAGYKDFVREVVLQPGESYFLLVRMEKDLRVRPPDVTATVKLSVYPKRAAVFVDGVFAGHVDEFDGVFGGMLVAPGKHRIEITLPGYQTFRTDISLLPYQKFELKTQLFPGDVRDADPLIVSENVPGN
ncbi:MAG: PEGA domain-containing protein [Acidobacteria bacterium]|nr:PEGA domain-containing protein [Acidobacteriota bacterium]